MIYDITLPSGILSFALPQDDGNYNISFTINISEVYKIVYDKFVSQNVTGSVYLQSIDMKYKAWVTVNDFKIWQSWTEGGEEFKSLTTNDNIRIEDINIKDKLKFETIKQKINCYFQISHPGFFLNIDGQEYTFLVAKRVPKGLIQINETDNVGLWFDDNYSTSGGLSSDISDLESSMTDNNWIVFNQGNRYQKFVIPVTYGENGFIRNRNLGIGKVEETPSKHRVIIYEGSRNRNFRFDLIKKYYTEYVNRTYLLKSGLSQSEYNGAYGYNLPNKTDDSIYVFRNSDGNDEDWHYHYYAAGWRKLHCDVSEGTTGYHYEREGSSSAPKEEPEGMAWSIESISYDGNYFSFYSSPEYERFIFREYVAYTSTNSYRTYEWRDGSRSVLTGVSHSVYAYDYRYYKYTTYSGYIKDDPAYARSDFTATISFTNSPQYQPWSWEMRIIQRKYDGYYTTFERGHSYEAASYRYYRYYSQTDYKIAVDSRGVRQTVSYTKYGDFIGSYIGYETKYYEDRYINHYDGRYDVYYTKTGSGSGGDFGVKAVVNAREHRYLSSIKASGSTTYSYESVGYSSGTINNEINSYVDKPEWKTWSDWYIDSSGVLHYGDLHITNEITNYDELNNFKYSL